MTHYSRLGTISISINVKCIQINKFPSLFQNLDISQGLAPHSLKLNTYKSLKKVQRKLPYHCWTSNSILIKHYSALTYEFILLCVPYFLISHNAKPLGLSQIKMHQTTQLAHPNAGYMIELLNLQSSQCLLAYFVMSSAYHPIIVPLDHVSSVLLAVNVKKELLLLRFKGDHKKWYFYLF